MKYLKFILVVLVAFLAACNEEQIQDSGIGTIKGRVVDKVKFEPVENVKITTSPATSTIFTDKDGYFVIADVPTGEYSVQALKEGFLAKFEPTNVTINAVSQVVFELETSKSSNKAPEVPTLKTPLDLAINQSIKTKLTWESKDPDADVLTYTVTLRNGVTDEIITFDNLKTNSVDLANLSYSTKYFWQVSVSDGINKPVNSSVFSFTTLSFPNSRFLFVKKVNGNNVIYAADDAGNQLPLTSTSLNSYRPRKNLQANKIAFLSSDGSQNHIYTMNMDGTAVKKVTNSIPVAGFNMDHVGFSWNSSGNQIIYPNFDKLYRINSDGTGLTSVFQTPNGKFISECVWSQDGSSIVLKVNNNLGYDVEIYVISSSGVLLYNVISNLSGAVSGLDSNVDNSRIVFSRDVSGFQNLEYRSLDARLFIFNTSSKTTQEILSKKLPGFNDLEVRFSPNQAEVIFVNTSNDGISSRNIQKVNLSDSDSRTTLFLGASMPDWK
ncbi:carboxypeptidase regulatory-like domain-containing protein [Flavobacterium sp. TSSA_36]|uniref:carboxypeptidase regulatory-like domain-containing protein n=1 Tax=Flavobacterium sp. TSSA_36 TaxID=3447669 RepID=UPI003F350160